MPTIIPFEPSISVYRFTTTLPTGRVVVYHGRGDAQKPDLAQLKSRTSLEAPYIFDVRWNSRDEAWYFDVRESDLTPIVFGIKIVLGTYLGRRSVHPLFRDGVMIARATLKDRDEAGFDDLGTRVSVMYFTRREVVNELISFRVLEKGTP